MAEQEAVGQLVAEQLAEAYQDEHDAVVREGWRIESLEAADWALRRLAELQRQVDENNEVCRASVERMKERTRKLNASAERGVAFFAGALQQYAEAHREQLLGKGKKKSRGLPSGDIGWRTVPEKVAVLDEAAAIAWARAQPVESELLRIREEVSKPALAAHYRETGEVPPGCDVTPAREEFQAKPATIESTPTRQH